MRVEGIEGAYRYLAHKKTPTPLGPPQDPRHRPKVVSYGGALSYERGTPVQLERFHRFVPNYEARFWP